jgi:hypothetical protein
MIVFQYVTSEPSVVKYNKLPIIHASEGAKMQK